MESIPTSLLILNILYSVVELGQIVVLILTVQRYRATAARTYMSEQGGAGSSTETKPPPSLSESRASARERQAMNTRYILTAGMVVCLIPKAIDTLALYSEHWIFVGLISFFAFANFGMLWLLYCTFKYMGAFYAAQCGVESVPFALRATTNCSGAFMAISVTISGIGLLVTQSEIYVAFFYLASAATILFFGIIVWIAMHSLTSMLKWTQEGLSASSKAEKEGKLKKFRTFGYGIVVMCVSVAVTCGGCTVIFLLEGDIRVTEIAQWKWIMLALQSNIMPQGSLAFIQYIQWPKQRKIDQSYKTSVTMSTRTVPLTPGIGSVESTAQKGSVASVAQTPKHLRSTSVNPTPKNTATPTSTARVFTFEQKV